MKAFSQSDNGVHVCPLCPLIHYHNCLHMVSMSAPQYLLLQYHNYLYMVSMSNPQYSLLQYHYYLYMVSMSTPHISCYSITTVSISCPCLPPNIPCYSITTISIWCPCLPLISPATVSQLSTYGVHVCPLCSLLHYHNCLHMESMSALHIFYDSVTTVPYIFPFASLSHIQVYFTFYFYILFFFLESCSQGAVTIFVDHILEINSFGKIPKKVKLPSFQFNKSFKIFR